MTASAGKLASDGAERRRRLVDIISRKSLLSGAEIQLTSGRSSSFYFDMKPTLFDPEAAGIIADLILEALAGRETDFIGGMEMGAVPIVACVAERSFPDRPVEGFFVRKQAKGHGTKRLVEGIPEGALAGKRVVLVEDVTTTGGSVLKAVEAARGEGARVDTVVTVVDRLEGAEAGLAAHDLALVSLLTAKDFEI
ncbi:MAG: orotate phosphoribosyltransferase [Alphaproteobacteria bacterium]|jgi:orotate phosphoribosyltransferase|nr:orotate phosphoribosyltransferase [Alphaproteobacteria bacterium]